MSHKSISFFAKVKDHEALRRTEFYAQDLSILAELGYDVKICLTPRDLRPADLYYVWWWTWACFPVAFARTLGRPVIVTGVMDYWKFDDRPAWQQQMMRFALKRAHANVFVSELEYQQVPQHLPTSNPSFCPLIVDTKLYSPGSALREDFVLTVAWMRDDNAIRKCIPEVVKAAHLIHREHPHIRFVVAGEKESYYPILEQMVTELGAKDYISFPGVISQEEKIDLMRRCKVYLQPSRFEGFGLAILEAMSCGASIVTSPVGAVPEVVGETARLVDGTSPEAIAEAVSALLSQEKARVELGQQARRRAETVFPYERRKRDLQRIIEQVWQGQGNNRRAVAAGKQ